MLDYLYDHLQKVRQLRVQKYILAALVRLLWVLAAFGIAAPAFAAFDNSTVCASGVSSSPAYCSFTVSSSAKVICVPTQGAVSGTDSTTNVQIGTASGTSTATKEGGAQTPSDRYSDMWCLMNPPTGTVTVRIDFTGTFLSAIAASYTNVGLIDAVVSGTGSSATSFSLTTTPTADQAWTVMSADNSNRTPAASTNTTFRNSAGISIGDSGAAITAPASITMNWTASIAGTWSGVIVALEPPVASTAKSLAGLVHASWIN